MTPMIYQVSFSVENVGKNQADSKKRVQWVYQIINNNNNNNGAAAPEQHTVEFTWSLRSGKQDVTLDGQTVLFSKKKGRSVFDEVLTQGGDSEGQQQPHLQLVCAQKPPLQAHPDFRCFELLIDQKPFGTYPQLHTNSNTQNVVVVVEPTEFTSTLAPGEDIMTVATPFYDGPMSILDILFPGKYSHAAPVQQLEMEPAMAFGGGGDENNTALTVSETPTVSPYALTTTPPEHQQAQPMVDLLA